MSSWVRDKQLHDSRSSLNNSKGSIRQQSIGSISPKPQGKPPSRAISRQSPTAERVKFASPMPSGREARAPSVRKPEPVPREQESPAKLSSVELKRAELNFKHFANRMDLMTKKALQEYFHLNDLQGSQIVDRLFFAFGKTISIDFESFLSAITVLAKGSPTDRAQFLFRMLDLKGTSLIDRNDLKKMHLSFLNAALSIDLDSEPVAEMQEEIRGQSAQDLEQAVDELVDAAVAKYGSHGNFLTLEEFTNYLLSDPLISKSLSL